jgi:peptidoglycan L-alanyl-D-glutamate endopeptidase CwlK
MSQFDTSSKPAASKAGTTSEATAPKLEYDMSVLTWGDQVTSGSTGDKKGGAGAETVFNRSYGDDAKPASAAAAAAAPAKDQPSPDKTAKDLKSGLANNPRAVRSLESLTGDKSYQSLSDDKKSELLRQFQTAPNDATTNFLRGMAEYEKAKAEDKSGDPAKEQERLAKLQDAKTPDAGTFSLSGKNYTIRDGKLVDTSGKDAGTIDNLGNYQMTGDKEASNYYNNIHARVKLQEGDGKAQKTLLDLHDADPNNQLSGPNMNNTFTGMAHDTLRAVRREGMDMGAAPQGAFRGFDEQNRLYAKGRTAPGKRVTGARGGESWHNYKPSSKTSTISCVSVAGENFHDQTQPPPVEHFHRGMGPPRDHRGAVQSAGGVSWVRSYARPSAASLSGSICASTMRAASAGRSRASSQPRPTPSACCYRSKRASPAAKSVSRSRFLPSQSPSWSSAS